MTPDTCERCGRRDYRFADKNRSDEMCYRDRDCDALYISRLTRELAEARAESEGLSRAMVDISHTCGSLRARLAEAEAVVAKLPRTKDGMPVVQGVDPAWTAPWDELEANGKIYRHTPYMSLDWTRDEVVSMYSTEAIAAAQPILFEPRTWCGDEAELLDDDFWCEVCENESPTCPACGLRYAEAKRKAEELNERTKALIAKYASTLTAAEAARKAT